MCNIYELTMIPPKSPKLEENCFLHHSESIRIVQEFKSIITQYISIDVKMRTIYYTYMPFLLDFLFGVLNDINICFFVLAEKGSLCK